MTTSLIAIIGWLGFIMCSLSYLLLNLKIIRFDRLWFQYLNVVGGMGLVVSSGFFKDMPNMASNLIWVIIAVFGVFRYSKKLRPGNKNRDLQPK